MSWLAKLIGKKRLGRGSSAGPAREPLGTPDTCGTVVRGGQRSTPVTSTTAMSFEPGAVIAGNLQIKKLLGRGGMGEVWLARQTQWDLDVAVKIPNCEVVADPENRHRIAREAEVWTDLGLHPHIAYCHYVQPLDELLLLVIEYVDGGNLRDWIANGRCADLKVGLNLAIQFCHGLERAHSRGLVHRDIKPENILLMKDGILKITDFGIVRNPLAGVGSAAPMSNVASTAAGMTMIAGTDEYMAPEQWATPQGVDHRADIFALGVCLYEMLCGRRPFLGDKPTLWPGREAPEPGGLRGDGSLPERLCELMRRTVAWEPERRPKSAVEVRAELCAVYEESFGETSLYSGLQEITTLTDDWNNRALSYLALGAREEAEKAWARALDADPRHAESVYNYGLHQWRAAKMTDLDVVRAMKEVCASRPGEWLPHYLLAQVHLERDDGEAALTALKEIAGAEAGLPEVRTARDRAEECRQVWKNRRRTFERITSLVESVALSVDGRWALGGSQDKTLRLWEVGTGRCVRIFEGHAHAVVSVALSADARLALSGSKDKALKLWDVPTGRCLRTFKGHSEYLTSVALSADGCVALSGSEDKTLKLWYAETDRCVRTFEAHADHVTAVALSADGRLALSGSWDATLKLWDVTTGECVRAFEGHSDCVSSVAFSADARLALSGSYDYTLKLWDVATGQCIRAFQGHTSWVTSLALSADGRWVLSGSSDNTLKLWDVANGRCRRTFEREFIFKAAMALNPDGRRALLVDDGVELCVWEELDQLGTSRAALRSSRPYGSRVALQAGAAYRRAIVESAAALNVGNASQAAVRLRAARSLPGYQRGAEALDLWRRLYRCLPKAAFADGWEAGGLSGHIAGLGCVALDIDGRFAVSGAWTRQSGKYDGELKLWEVAVTPRNFPLRSQSVSSD